MAWKEVTYLRLQMLYGLFIIVRQQSINPSHWISYSTVDIWTHYQKHYPIKDLRLAGEIQSTLTPTLGLLLVHVTCILWVSCPEKRYPIFRAWGPCNSMPSTWEIVPGLGGLFLCRKNQYSLGYSFRALCHTDSYKWYQEIITLCSKKLTALDPSSIPYHTVVNTNCQSSNWYWQQCDISCHFGDL